MVKKITIDWDEKENVEWQIYAPDVSKKNDPSLRRKLLITTDNFLPRWDGISRFLSEILPRLKMSYDITVVAPDYGPVDIPGITVVSIPLAQRSYGDYTPPKFAYKKIKSLVRQSDVVFNQGLGPIGICGILAAKRVRRPIVSYIHSVEWELVPKALASPSLRGPLVAISKAFTRACYNRCTVLILPSENIAEQFSWQRITAPKKIAHLGVDTAKFFPEDKSAVRASLNIPSGAFVVGYHGRIAHEKNLLTLLRGFRQLKMKEKRLLIVGDGVATIREKLGRFDDIIVTGATNNVVPYLQAMDIYVQPSFTETTSLSVLEAMSCGLPVVSSKVGFIKYYIIDGQNGMFFDNNNPRDLATKLHVLEKDRSLRERIASNARKTIEKSFRWDQTAQKIKEILDSV